MERRLVITTVIGLFLSHGFLGAQTVQELGLPNPVEFEAVFPHVAFGTTGALALESEIVVVNPTDHRALLEFELRHPSSGSATILLDEWANRNQFTHSKEDGKLYGEVFPHAIKRLTLSTDCNPDPTEPFLKCVRPLTGLFSGWIILRSNYPLTAHQEIRLTHLESSRSDRASLVGNYVGAKLARGSVSSLKCDIFSADPIFAGGKTIGWYTVTSGAALANPGTKPLILKLTLGSEELNDFQNAITLQLPPGSQKPFLIHEPFPFFRSANCSGLSTKLHVKSESGEPFALTIIHQGMDIDLEGRLRVFGIRKPVNLDGPGDQHFPTLRTPETTPFNLPVRVLQQANVRDLRLTLTRFGLSVSEAGGKPLGLWKVNHGDGIKADPALGVAVVYGGFPVRIVFTGSRKVVTAETESQADSPTIKDIPEKGQIEIRLGHRCYRLVILLDKQKEEIISVQWQREPGAFCL